MLAKSDRNCLYLLRRNLSHLVDTLLNSSASIPTLSLKSHPLIPRGAPAAGAPPDPAALPSGAAAAPPPARPPAHVPIFSSPLEKGKQQSCPMASTADCRPAAQATAVRPGCSPRRNRLFCSESQREAGRERQAPPRRAAPRRSCCRFGTGSTSPGPRGPGSGGQPALSSGPCEPPAPPVLALLPEEGRALADAGTLGATLNQAGRVEECGAAVCRRRRPRRRARAGANVGRCILSMDTESIRAQ